MRFKMQRTDGKEDESRPVNNRSAIYSSLDFHCSEMHSSHSHSQQKLVHQVLLETSTVSIYIIIDDLGRVSALGAVKRYWRKHTEKLASKAFNREKPATPVDFPTIRHTVDWAKQLATTSIIIKLAMNRPPNS